MKHAAALALVRGRPNTYYPEFPDLAERMLLLKPDAQVADLAEYFGCSITTIVKWKAEHPEFAAACAKGGVIADANVARSLYERALGYSHPAVKIMLGPGGNVMREEYIEHYPPDTNAANLWLANRQRGRWSMRPEAPTDGADGVSEVRIVGGLPDADD